MGMQGILCALSDKRRAMLEDDPELFSAVLSARHEEQVPGLLDLDRSWHALDVLLGEGEDAVLGDAVLGRRGRSFGPSLAFGRPKLLEPPRVVEVAGALSALPKDTVERGYGSLAGRTVHGGYGPKESPASQYDDLLVGVDDHEVGAERAELRTRFEAVRRFYREAAERGDSVLAVVI